MRRVAGTKRGEGKYEKISWDEAITEITDTMKSIKEKYGNDAFYIQYGTGQLGGTISKAWAPDNTVFARLMNCYGGYLRHYCDYSTGQITWELPLFSGDAWSNNEALDMANSELIVLFGNNPANTRMSGSAFQYLLTKAKELGKAEIIVVDPHLTDTAIALADQWVALRPGTDPALIHGMMHHLHTSGQLDEAWIRENCVGFYSDAFAEDMIAAEPSNEWQGFDSTGSLTIEGDMSYEAYLMGIGAYVGTGEKNTAWAAAITGVPAATIADLADKFISKTTCTVQGWGPQRHSIGGNTSRCIGMLAALTGNVGISGGGTGARESTGGVGFALPGAIPNLIEKNGVDPIVSFYVWYQAIENYKVMNDATWGIKSGKGPITEPGTVALKAPIKFIWNYGTNVMLGQHGDLNDSLRIYNLPDTDDSGLTMVVTVENHYTPTASISDIILPGTTNFEETDVITGGGGYTGFAVCESPASEPLFEAKSVYDICTLIAQGLGIEDEFTEGRTQEDWVKWLYDEAIAAGETGIGGSYDEFVKKGLWKKADSHTPGVAELKAGELATPSGKFEVFSKLAYNISKQWDITGGGLIPDDGLDQITGIPEWYGAWGGFADEALKAEYPFQVIGHHFKSRTHSSYGNVPWLSETTPQTAWINAGDAATLGIETGDKVEIFNNFGRTQLPAKVTYRIMPGVISIPQGAWYTPESDDPTMIGNRNRLEVGGCVNVLTSTRPTSFSKGNGQHSILAGLKKVGA